MNRNQALILTYHRFAAQSNSHRVSAREFEQHLKYLKKFTTIVSLERLAELLSEQRPFPPNATVITIDDGYRDSYDVAFPLLQRYGVPATLFVITDFLEGKKWLWTDLMRYALLETKNESIFLDGIVNEPLGTRLQRIGIADRINGYLKTLREEEKTLKIDQIANSLGVTLPEQPTTEFGPITWEEARDMDSNGVRIESHTVSHPILPNVDKADLRTELRSSKQVLAGKLGRDIDFFCYPNGAYNDTVKNEVKHAGYTLAVATEYGFCEMGSDHFALPRIDGQPSIANFAQSVSGFERVREKIGI